MAPRLLRGARGLQEGVRGRDQARLPQAGAQVPPRPQPGRRGGRGALQGGPGGLRHALRPREAQAVRRRRACSRRLRRPRGLRRRPAEGGSPPTSATSSRRSSGAAAARGGAASRVAGATSRPRSGCPSSRRWRERRSRSRSRSRRPARSAAAPARSRAPRRSVCPRCGGRGIDSAEPGPLLDQPAVPAVRRRAARSSRTPCRDCGGLGLTDAAQALPGQHPAGVRDGTRIRLRRQGRGRPPRRPAGRPLRDHQGLAFAGVQAARATATSRSSCRSRSRRRSRAATVEVPTLNGTKRIRVPAGTRHGTVQRLRGEGPPKPGGRGRGDILYRLEIEVPRDLTREQKRRARRASPRRSTTTIRASACCARRAARGSESVGES